MDFDKCGMVVLILTFIVVLFSSNSAEGADVMSQNFASLFNRPLEPLRNYSASSRSAISRMRTHYNISDCNVPTAKQKPYCDVLTFDKREDFSLFIEAHTDLAKKIVKIFLDAKNVKELYSVAAAIRDNINPYLFSYSLSVALMHRSDTREMKIPNQIQCFPYKYFDKEVFYPARAQLAMAPADRTPIELKRTASDAEDEHRLAFWREDIALNIHHWSWHIAYPSRGERRVIDRDRRGELFYYMHEQAMGRYNFERLCADLKLVDSLSNWPSPIKEAYFPMLDNFVAKGIYPSRPKNMILSDINIPSQRLVITIASMVRLNDRIQQAMDLGYVEGRNGEKIPLDNVTGIDILGNVLESSDLSPNPRYYGNLHGNGHIVIAYIHDPNHYHLQPMAIMGDTATNMRDPIFYRWHTFCNEIFVHFLNTLRPYTANELNFPQVRVDSVSVKSDGENLENIFRTYWKQTDVDLIHGLDFAPQTGAIFVRYTHLNHRNFTYRIVVTNSGQTVKQGVCRIYLAPAIDESRKPWTLFTQQKGLFIELDKFKVTLQPGINNITRNSVDSTVTIPFEETFYDFDNDDDQNKSTYDYSGCGWPHNLLIPKGVEDGFPCHLFVIISSYEEDEVPNSHNSGSEAYCGVKGSKFPYKRPMGYPFDRLPRAGVRTLGDFLTPNMHVQNCQIHHKDGYE